MCALMKRKRSSRLSGEKGTFKIIDKVGVRLNQRKDVYEATLSNLGIKDALAPAHLVKEHEKLLTRWNMVHHYRSILF